MPRCLAAAIPRALHEGLVDHCHQCQSLVRFRHRGLVIGRTTDPLTQYYLDTAYNEVEGIAPDGSWTAVECGPGFGMGLDICRLDLDRPGNKLQRMTHFLDYGQHRVSNPVISPDGRMMAFQYGRAEDEAGVGRGLLLMDLTSKIGGP